MLGWIASWWSAKTKQPAFKQAAKQEEAFEDTSEDLSAILTPVREEAHAAQQEDFATPELTPELPSHLRFMVQRGQVVGVENTVRRYQEHRPVKLHCTPFEKRVDDVMAQEEELEVVPLQQLNLNVHNININAQQQH